MAQSTGDPAFSWKYNLASEVDMTITKEGMTPLTYSYSLTNWGSSEKNSNTSGALNSSDVSSQFSSLLSNSLWSAPIPIGNENNGDASKSPDSFTAPGVWPEAVISTASPSDSATPLFSPDSNQQSRTSQPTSHSPLVAACQAQPRGLESGPVIQTSLMGGWSAASASTVSKPSVSSQNDPSLSSPLPIGTWPSSSTAAAPSSVAGGDGSPTSGKQEPFMKPHLSRVNSLATNQSKSGTSGNGPNANDMEAMVNKINSTDGWNASCVDQKTAWLEDEQSVRQKAAAESNVWANEPPNGTGLWEKHYEAIGERIARWNPPPVQSSWEAAAGGNASVSSGTTPSTPMGWPRPADISSPVSGGMTSSPSVTSHWHDGPFHQDVQKDKVSSPMQDYDYNNRLGRGGGCGEQHTRAIALSRLRAHGFTTEAATNALIVNNMDVDRALNFLRAGASQNSPAGQGSLSNNPLRFGAPNQSLNPSVMVGLPQHMASASPTTAMKAMTDSSQQQQLQQQQQQQHKQTLQTLIAQENHLIKAMTTLKHEVQRYVVLIGGGANISGEPQLRLAQMQQQYQALTESLKQVKEQQVNCMLKSRNSRPLAGGMGGGLAGAGVDFTAAQMADMRINSFNMNNGNEFGNDNSLSSMGGQWPGALRDDVGFPTAGNPMSRTQFGGKNDFHDDGTNNLRASLGNYAPNDGLSAIGGRRRQPDCSAFEPTFMSSHQMGLYPPLNQSQQGQPSVGNNCNIGGIQWVIVRNLPNHINLDALRAHLTNNNIFPVQFHPHVIAHWVLIGLNSTEDTNRALHVLQQCLPHNCSVEPVTDQEISMKMKDLENLASRFGTGGGAGSGFRLGGGGGNVAFNFNSGGGVAQPPSGNSMYGTGNTATTPTGGASMAWPLGMGGSGDFTTAPFPGPGDHVQQQQAQSQSLLQHQNAAMFSMFQRSQASSTATNNNNNNNVSANNDASFMFMNMAANRNNPGASAGHY